MDDMEERWLDKQELDYYEQQKEKEMKLSSLDKASAVFDAARKKDSKLGLKVWCEKNDVPYQALRSLRAMKAKEGVQIVYSRERSRPSDKQPEELGRIVKLGRPKGKGTSPGRTKNMRESAELRRAYELLGKLYAEKGGKL